MSAFFDALETRSPELRERDLMAALPDALSQAIARAPAIAEQLDGIDPRGVTTRQALAELPVLRKHELLEKQQHSRAGDSPDNAAKALGGFATIGWGQAL